MKKNTLIELDAKKNILTDLGTKFFNETEPQMQSLIEQRHSLFKARNLIGRVIVSNQNLNHEARYQYKDVYVAGSDILHGDMTDIYGKWNHIHDYIHEAVGFTTETNPRFIKNESNKNTDNDSAV